MEIEAERSMAPELWILCGALYLSMTFSGDILKLPEEYGGYGVKDLYTLSVCEQAKIVVSNLRRNDNTSNILKILVRFH